MTEQLGRVLGGRYRLRAPIGTGASAEVYLADDVTLRRRVAVKVLHPALADDEAFLRRFRAEAQAAAALSHPNLMQVFDWGEADGPYLVLEFLGGGSLRAMLDQGRRLTASQALMVGLDTARALDFAARAGFVHRDIKPANLLFGDDGRLRIADFGLARALSEAAWTEPDGLVGTARYAAPEQATGGRVDGKADVYALGLVLIEAVTGTVPLVAETTLGTLAGRVDVAVPVPAALGPLVPALERAGQPDPADRPDADAFGKALYRSARDLDKPEPLPLVGAVDLATVRQAFDADPTLLPSPAGGSQPSGVSPAAGNGAGNGNGGDADATTAGRSGPPTAVFDLEAFDDEAPRTVVDDDAPPPGRRRRRRWPWVVVLLLVLAGAAGGGTFAYIEAQPATALVPEVDDRPRPEAEAELARVQAEAELAWNVQIDEEFHESVPEGFVVRQAPPPGTVLEEGMDVVLLVSKGRPFQTVPDLSGLTEDAAEATLIDEELALGKVDAVHDETVTAGLVLDWSAGGEPRPAELRKGSEVDVVVSSGPAPRTVPNLAGRTSAQAVAALREIGLRAEVSERFSNSVDNGVVIGTDPGAGATVKRDDTVSVVVSKGRDLVTVPDIAGKTLAEVNQLLTDAGLTPDEVTGPAQGSPFTTDPQPGAQVDRGTAVDIFLKR
jgi:serine/threonine-protein kinase